MRGVPAAPCTQRPVIMTKHDFTREDALPG